MLHYTTAIYDVSIAACKIFTHSISLLFLTISEVSFSDLNLVINVARHDWVVSQPGAYSQERDMFNEK